MEVLMRDSSDGLVSRGGRISSQGSKECCALEKACLAKMNEQSGGLLEVFKSGVEFLSKNREKTTFQNNKQPHRHGIHGGLLLKALPLAGGLQGHKDHQGSAHISR